MAFYSCITHLVIPPVHPFKVLDAVVEAIAVLVTDATEPFWIRNIRVCNEVAHAVFLPMEEYSELPAAVGHSVGPGCGLAPLR